MKVLAVLVVMGVALISSAAAIAKTETTGPGQRVNITVEITDNDIRVGEQASFYRGSIVTFYAYNGGKKLHNFAFLGKKTPAIKPKHWSHFTVTLLTRGRFPFKSTLDKGIGFHGVFAVI